MKEVPCEPSPPTNGVLRNPISECYLIQTPIPYLSGVAHLGTLSQALRCDTWCKLAKAFKKDVEFPYGFHVTGIPVYLKLKTIEKRLQEGKDLKQVLKENGFDHLLPYCTGVPRGLLQWARIFRAYYKSVFRKIGINNEFLTKDEFYMTTWADPGYDLFVNQLYKILREEDKIKSGLKQILFCDTCRIPLGDHERATGSGLGLKKLFLCEKTDLERVLNSKEVYIKNSKGQSYRGPAENWSQVMKPGVATVIPDKITCRCGRKATIETYSTLFIRWDKEWKDKAIELIQNLKSTSSVKRALKDAIVRLEDYSFLRNKEGFGSCLDIAQGTEHEGLLVDPLGDSPLHIWYPFLKSKGLALNEPKSGGPSIYITALDLVPNHLALMIMMYALKSLNLGQLPCIQVTGYLTDSKDEKMSKSQGNVIVWEDLEKQGLTGTDFRRYLCTLSDTTESNPVSFAQIKRSSEAVKKSLNKLRRAIQSLHVSSKTQAFLKKIENLVRPWQDGVQVPGFRKIYHSVSHELKASLSSQDFGLDHLKPLIKTLIEAYD